MTHRNASLTPKGRLKLAQLVVDEGWSVRRAAERFQTSPATASKWAERYRAGASMEDRSSRPHTSPTRTSPATEQQIITLRQSNQWGPHRIGYQLGIPRSTVDRVLDRHQMPHLKHLDRMTGEPVRAPQPVLYEMATPGELIHVDIKKLGRIPDGGGHRVVGRAQGNQNKRTGGPRGHAYLHHAVDSYSRVVYSEILNDERKETAAGFWLRANTFFVSIGVTVTAVMTDNGACYRSRAFAAALGTGIHHRFTRPYRPQTNGKVERFNRTLLAEWAYATTPGSVASHPRNVFTTSRGITPSNHPHAEIRFRHGGSSFCLSHFYTLYTGDTFIGRMNAWHLSLGVFMGFITGLIQAAITLGAIALVILIVAALFLIVFSIPNIFDKRLNNW